MEMENIGFNLEDTNKEFSDHLERSIYFSKKVDECLERSRSIGGFKRLLIDDFEIDKLNKIGCQLSIVDYQDIFSYLLERFDSYIEKLDRGAFKWYGDLGKLDYYMMYNNLYNLIWFGDKGLVKWAYSITNVYVNGFKDRYCYFNERYAQNLNQFINNEMGLLRNLESKLQRFNLSIFLPDMPFNGYHTYRQSSTCSIPFPIYEKNPIFDELDQEGFPISDLRFLFNPLIGRTSEKVDFLFGLSDQYNKIETLHTHESDLQFLDDYIQKLMPKSEQSKSTQKEVKHDYKIEDQTGIIGDELNQIFAYLDENLTLTTKKNANIEVVKYSTIYFALTDQIAKRDRDRIRNDKLELFEITKNQFVSYLRNNNKLGSNTYLYNSKDLIKELHRRNAEKLISDFLAQVNR